jgi:hypothetical protein
MANDVVLPQQYLPAANHLLPMRGEVALLYAVLEDAVSCLQKGQYSRNRRVQRWATEAEQWFFTDAQDSLCTFVNICSVLGLDPDYLRSGLQQWHHQPEPGQQKKHRRTQVTYRSRLSARG